MSDMNATTAAAAETLDANQTGEVSLYELLKVVPNSEMDVVSGYVSTAVVLFTVVTNCIVCVVLLKPHMRTSPTNIILVSLSITTTLTGVWSLPCNVYFYVLGGYVDWVPAGWCFAFECLNDYLPTIFHTASIWLTVLLAVQRYVSVCHSGTAAARRFRTVDNALRAIVGVMVAAVMSHAFRFAERRFTAVAVPSMSGDGRTVSACVDELVPFVYHNQHVYYSVYYVFRVVFVNVLPCTVLVLLNAALVHTMRAAETRRKALLKHHRRSESRRLAESNSTTLMLIVVVGVFLLVEFPMAVIFMTLIFSNVFELNVFDPSSSSMASSIVNLCILFSYLFNFFIYCAMSRQFRETFCRLFVHREASPDRGSRVISLHGTSTHGGVVAEVGYSQVPETDQRETV